MYYERNRKDLQKFNTCRTKIDWHHCNVSPKPCFTLDMPDSSYQIPSVFFFLDIGRAKQKDDRRKHSAFEKQCCQFVTAPGHNSTVK
jgi:hypothetical protein